MFDTKDKTFSMNTTTQHEAEQSSNASFSTDTRW